MHLAAVISVIALVEAALAGQLERTVAGQNYRLEVLGRHTSPTVVFEAGQGNGPETWKRVAGPVSDFARVVLYARSGLGGSVPLADTTSPVTAEHVATNLKALLAAAGLAPPFILVGHSLGGLYVQMYARRYPAQVSGVVLVESASPSVPDEMEIPSRLEPGSAAFLEDAGVRESNRQVAEAGPFPDVPLIVIAATDHGPAFRKWERTLMELQEQLATLSPQATLIIAKGSGHDVQLDRPDLVVDAIRHIVSRAR